MLNGIIYDDGFKRMPESVSKNISEAVNSLSKYTSGGRIRFITDSKTIAIDCDVTKYTTLPHMTKALQTGIDIYVDDKFSKMSAPTNENMKKIKSSLKFDDKKMREIVIHLPLYNGIENFYIGLSNNSIIKKPSSFDKKIVFYGSSITQGACASRPSNCFASMIARRFNCDFLNLGFSGNAKGEIEMAIYIASQKMDIFVYDYDHNATDALHLEQTHQPFFEIIRNENKDLPIIIVTKPDYLVDLENSTKRYDIIYNTYKTALSNGDKNVYFVDGKSLWNVDYEACSIDGTHPNDLGMWSMANIIGDVIDKIL